MSESSWEIKRFVLMTGSVYYASGGFEDFISSHNTKEEAEAAMKVWLEESGDYTWAHIGDLQTGDYWGSGHAHNSLKALR